MKIPLFDLNFDNQETDAVIEVLKNKWISMGPKVHEFEDSFAKKLNLNHAVAVNNCTSALTLAFKCLGIQPGDEVIVPSLTFVATANAAAQLGAKIIFADVTSLTDWTISIDDVKSKITSKTKAIVPVHYAGYLCDMPKLKAIADQHNLKLIEDGAHSPCGYRESYTPGQIGDALCLSFFANKNITTGEGGMVLCQDENLFQNMKLARSHGITTSSYERSLGKEFYDVIDYGYNFRMTDINAAIGCVQLTKLQEDTEKRDLLVKRYRSNLELSNIECPFIDYDGISSNYIFPILLPKNKSKNEVRAFLESNGIQTSFHYPPAHQFDHYSKQNKTHLPITEDIAQRTITLPLYKSLNFDQVDYVCKYLIEAINA